MPSETLRVFHVDNLLLLALVTEFTQCVDGFIHSWDGKGQGSGQKPSGFVIRLIHHGRVAGALRTKFKHLFHYGDGDGDSVPFVIHPGYERGYVQLMVHALGIGIWAAHVS